MRRHFSFVSIIRLCCIEVLGEVLGRKYWGHPQCKEVPGIYDYFQHSSAFVRAAFVTPINKYLRASIWGTNQG